MRAKKFTAVLFIGVLAVLMCLVFAGISVRASKKLMSTSKAVKIDWEKLYPFDESAHYKPEPKKSLPAFVKKKLEEYTSEKMAGGFRIIEAARTYDELIDWNMAAVNSYNPVIKLHDGYLSGLVASRDVSENAEAVKELDDFCRSLGIDYVYINYPAKICVSQDKDISGILDFSNQNADNLLRMLSDSGVRVYDFSKTLHDEGRNHHEAFFVTDHHWKPETGLWAAKHILQILRDDYGWDVDSEILNPEKFEYKVYPEWFLGSQGKKLTLARTKPDDFTIIYPKFRTRLRFEVPSRGIDTSGDLSVTYDMKQAETRDYYRLNPYAAYKHADLPLSRIHNLLNHNGRKVLFIHDSVSNSVIPFAALGLEITEEMDLRSFTGSLRSYIKSSKPDLVITAYYATIPGRTEPVGKKFFDFR